MTAREIGENFPREILCRRLVGGGASRPKILEFCADPKRS
jgi:hypothetical protein